MHPDRATGRAGTVTATGWPPSSWSSRDLLEERHELLRQLDTARASEARWRERAEESTAVPDTAGAGASADRAAWAEAAIRHLAGLQAVEQGIARTQNDLHGLRQDLARAVEDLTRVIGTVSTPVVDPHTAGRPEPAVTGSSDHRSMDAEPDPPAGESPAHLRARPEESQPPAPKTSIPDWRREPLALAGVDRRALKQLERQLVPYRSRLVSLGERVTVQLMSCYLPPGFSMQPDGDAWHSRTVLLYRHNASPAPDTTSRRVSRMLDLLGLLSPDQRLDKDLHSMLDEVLPRILGLTSTMQHHVRARACWRRIVPVRAEELQPVISALTPRGRRDLADLFEETVSGRPDLRDRARDLLDSMGLSGVQVDQRGPALHPVRGVIGSVSVPRPRTPTDPSTAEPAHVGTAAHQYDMGRVLLRRSETERAHAALAALDEEEVEPGGHGHRELREPAEVMDAPSPGGLPSPLLELVRAIADDEQVPLSRFRARSVLLGLVPLDAVRQINEWAETLLEASGVDVGTLVEVDTTTGTVWIDPTLKELLS
jgi:hypothetical protein